MLKSISKAVARSQSEPAPSEWQRWCCQKYVTRQAVDLAEGRPFDACLWAIYDLGEGKAELHCYVHDERTLAADADQKPTY